MNNIQFTCPRAVSAGELVMDPSTGRWGFARQNYNGGDQGTFATGSGFVMDVAGTVQPGSLIYCRNGAASAAPTVPDQQPCARVDSVMGVTDGRTSALVTLC